MNDHGPSDPENSAGDPENSAGDPESSAGDPESSAGDLRDSAGYDRRVVTHRIVQLGILLSITWKVSFFHWSLTIYEAIPIKDSFFPEIFRSNVILCVAYVIAVGSSVMSVLTASHLLKRIAAWSSFLSLAVLCLHQGSYNDATFTTSWWAALWTIWFVSRMDREPEAGLLPRAAFLGRAMVSMILLGGAVGKWTHQYWSGEVLHDIYFVDRSFWVFDLLRSNFDVQALPEIAKWYSRVVVMTETILGLGLWLLPAKVASVIAIVVLASIAIFSNFLLFSVLLSLIGLAAIGLLVPKNNR